MAKTVPPVRVDLDEALDRIEARDGKRPSMTSLGQQLGHGSPKTLHNWRAGEYLKTVAQLKELAHIAGMSMDELIIYEEHE